MFKRKPEYADSKIIADILQGGILAEKAAGYINQTFKGFLFKVMKRYRLSYDDTLDIYTDSVVTVIQKIKTSEYKGDGKLSTYFFGILSHKCIDRIRQISTNKYKRENDWTDEIPDIGDSSRNFLRSLMLEEEMEKVRNLLDLVGAKCKELLWNLDYWGYQPKEIVEIMGFKNEKSVKSQKYKCKEKLRALLKEADFDIRVD